MRGRTLYARLAEVAPAKKTAREQADALGITTGQLKFVRYRARLMGFDVGELETDFSLIRERRAAAAGEPDRPMSRGEQMLAQMAGPPCDRCGLRGPHECLTKSDPFARPGLGPIFPVGMNLSSGEIFKHRDGRQTAKAAAIRLGVDEEWLANELKRAGLKRTGAYWKLAPEVYDRVVADARRRANGS